MIKPIRFDGVRRVGDPAELTRRYNDAGIDELIYVDAVASLYGRNAIMELVRNANREAFTPLTVAGGVKSVEDVRELISFSYADKVAINTAAIERPELLTEIADKFGDQAMVVQIDAKRKDNRYEAYCKGGRQPTGKDAVAWAEEAQRRGAGEVFLTSIDQDGTRQGPDLELIRAVTRAVPCPVVYSGGCGSPADVVAAFGAGADAVAVAGLLHFGLASVAQIKTAMLDAGYPVRL